MTKLFLGIDLGGTEVKVAVVDEKGTIVEMGGFPNTYNSVPKKVVQNIISCARQMKNFKKLSGTGVGVAGDIDQKNGIVRVSPNMGHWKNVPLKKMLKPFLPNPIVIDNDANAAAWGAYWLDAKGKVKNLICVTLGTGVGGGLICEGRLYRGATGTAGEIGHMPLNPSGPRCNCGSYGCIERYVGAKYLSQTASEAVTKGKSRILIDLVGGNLDAITPYILTLAAKRHDPIAKQVWTQAGERLGIVLAGVVNLINPEVIVLSGGISRAGSLILTPLKKTIQKRAFKKPAQACRIVISKYTKKLGVVGAALLAR